ncbi:MAG: hypothetical protein LKJ51_01880 [Limosilactobacillus sp.]|jgi:hypothetical protein|uniref:hypothetical protein n=1 Tax=Limosilactobacillus sp. TaxID=2773925 RepID=UPI0025C6B384|nr:hypothetical protein [Limosilactobacillus sp.]MCI1974654.1 hypothetical protein [Limosilactobacillus sp.]MCI2031193.1 hypothetical protein [Limosilactobacillus sp.]
MREIPIKQAKAFLKRSLKGKLDQQVKLLTKKKDRSLTLVMRNDELTLIEQGYVNSSVTYQRGSSDAKHKIAIAFKREFPRSHQLYLVQKVED